MNSISLTQLSAFVVAVSMASLFVMADDALAHTTEEENVVAVETDILVNSKVSKIVEESTDKFTFTSLDTDKDGKLSKQEVITGQNEWLVRSFKKIDSNANEEITEQELVDFVAKKAATISMATN